MSITVTPLMGGGYLGENPFIVTDDATGKTAVVDPCFERGTAALEAYKPDMVLLTHGHFDHAAHCEALREQTGAVIYAHKEEESLLSSPRLNLSVVFGGSISIKADHLVDDGARIQLGETEILVMHTPGHTAGSCCFLADGHLFTGDTLMAGSAGRTDFPCGDSAAQAVSLKRLKELPKSLILHCGHGPDTTLAEELQTNPFMQ